MKAKLVKNSLNEFVDSPGEYLGGEREKIKEIKKTLWQIYYDHERDAEEFDEEEYEEFIENEEFQPLYFNIEDAQYHEVDRGFRYILENPEMAEKALEEIKDETGFGGIEVIDDNEIMAWWGKK